MYVILGNSLSLSIKRAFNEHANIHGTFKILDASLAKFASGEAFAEIIPGINDIRGQPIVVVQSTGTANDHSANDYAMESLLTIHNLRKNGAGPIWEVEPFGAYARQDRAFDGRMTSVAIDSYGMLLKASGAVGYSTIEIHSQAALEHLQGHFGVENVFNIEATELFAREIKALNLEGGFMVGGPDKGAHERAKKLALRLGGGHFSIGKKHESADVTKVESFEGDVDGATTITFDDMVDRGGTMVTAQDELISHGAGKRIVGALHGLFSNGGHERLLTHKARTGGFAIDYTIVTDTVDPSRKISDLANQYGIAAAARVRAISVGSLLVDHVVNDIARHPDMRVA